MDKINCIIKEPGKKARAGFIDNTLQAFQEAVGGYIETLPVGEDAVMVMNENGKLDNLPANFWIELTKDGMAFRAEPRGYISDAICGTIIIVGAGEEDFEDLDIELQGEILNQLWAMQRAKKEVRP